MRCVVLLLFLHISVISTAPLLQLLQQNQMMSLQKQLFELEAMQQFYPMSQIGLDTLPNPLQPLIIILPDDQTNSNTNVDLKNGNKHEGMEQLKTKTMEDDSVVIDAEPIPTIDGRKTIVVLPSGRFSIGDFISAIPFLPIEINVPDTISWIGSGISGIISGIGQRFPFQRPLQTTVSNVDVTSNMNNIQMKAQYSPIIMKPIAMLPLAANRHILPI